MGVLSEKSLKWREWTSGTLLESVRKRQEASCVELQVSGLQLPQRTRKLNVPFSPSSQNVYRSSKDYPRYWVCWLHR